MEEYEGFQIVWADPPASQNMWGLHINSDADDLRDRLHKYIRQHGPFHSPVGPLAQALAAAHHYIDEVLAYSSG